MKVNENNSLIYLYCITRREPVIGELISLNSTFYTIHHRGLYAVVGIVSKDDFEDERLKENLNDMEWLRNKVNLHECVIEGVMKGASVIPFRFGTVFFSEDNVKAMIERHESDFERQLKNFQDKEEWGVKIYYDSYKLRKFLLKEDKDLLRMEKEISLSSPGKAFLLEKKKETLFKELIQRRVNKFCELCFHELSKVSLKSYMNKLLPKEVTERHEDMVFNVAFFVEKSRAGQFAEKVENIKGIYVDRGLFVDCTGPWPPYNFCMSMDKTVLKSSSPSTPTSHSWGPKSLSGPQPPHMHRAGLSFMEGSAK